LLAAYPFSDAIIFTFFILIANRWKIY